MENSRERQRDYQQHTSQTTFSPISVVLASVVNSTSMSETQPLNLSTTGKDEVKLALIGKPPSEIVLDGLRKCASSVNKGHLLDDKALETLLVQHFGPMRFCAKKVTKHVYGPDGQYDQVVKGFRVSLDTLHDAEMKLFDAVEYLNRPSRPEFVTDKLADLRAVMARASESQADLGRVIATYAEHLCQYPPDVVAYVIDRTIATKKWFPLVSELREEIDELMRFRRALLKSFEDCRNPLRAKKPLAIDDNRAAKRFDEVPKSKWLRCHYDQFIGHARTLVDYYRKMGKPGNVSQWEAQIAEVEAELNGVPQ